MPSSIIHPQVRKSHTSTTMLLRGTEREKDRSVDRWSQMGAISQATSYYLIYQYLNDHVSRNTCMIKAVQMISGENQRSTSRGRHQGCECNLPIHYRDVAPCTWPIRQLRSDVVLYCIRHLTARQRTGVCFMETFDVVPSPDEY